MPSDSPRKKTSAPNYNVRQRILLLAIYAFMAVLVMRLIYLQVIRHDFFVQKSKQQVTRVFTLSPTRGEIFDSEGEILAFSRPAYSIYAVPVEIPDKQAFAKVVAPLLEVPVDRVYRQINNKQFFVWLKRKVPTDVYAAIKKAGLPGINAIREDKRVYPHGTLAADVLGFVGIDNQGLGGLEYRYDAILKGAPGKVVVEGDPRGARLLSGQKTSAKAFDGGRLYTTLDMTIQFFTQKYLREGALSFQAESAQAIVMNVKTGDVLALADYPEFDPNHWSDSSSRYRRNSAVTDMYEPGSVFKIVTVAAALDLDLVTTQSVLIVPERIMVGGRPIREAHGRSEGETDRRTVSEILEKSLNVGTSLLAQKVGQDDFFSYIESFRFGQKSDVELPGESAGLLRPVKSWTGPDIAMVSFGQGIAVTPLQMSAAVAAVANNGILMKPRIVRHVSYQSGTRVKGVPLEKRGQVVSEETSAEVLKVMEMTVERGTAVGARIPGYRIGGKTGTAQKPRTDGRGYDPGKYIASFVGVFPIDDPTYLVLVIVDTPKGSIWGSTVAVPVFRQIAAKILDYYDVMPTVPVE
jgi:cell division protein FtsI/penicillin-binding protein 2